MFEQTPPFVGGRNAGVCSNQQWCAGELLQPRDALADCGGRYVMQFGHLRDAPVLAHCDEKLERRQIIFSSHTISLHFGSASATQWLRSDSRASMVSNAQSEDEQVGPSSCARLQPGCQEASRLPRCPRGERMFPRLDGQISKRSYPRLHVSA